MTITRTTPIALLWMVWRCEEFLKSNFLTFWAWNFVSRTLDFAALSKITKERKVRIVRQEPRFYFENIEAPGKLFKFVIETKDGFSKCSSDFTLLKNGPLALQNKSRFMDLHSGLHFKKGEEFTLKIKVSLQSAESQIFTKTFVNSSSSSKPRMKMSKR